MKIAIPGGSGQIGTLLARHFQSQGHDVTVLTRAPRPAPWRVIQWDATTPGDWIDALTGADICINLTGRSVNCRHNEANRQAIWNSRVQSTRLLGEVLPSLNPAPRLWLNASTAAIYPNDLDHAMTENDAESVDVPHGATFSIKLAHAWESSLFASPTPNIRKIALRTTLAFSPDRGNVFDVLLGLVRRGLGGAQGPGTQYVSWIHEADFVRAIDFVVAHEELSGAINFASPNPVPNTEFMRDLRAAWGSSFGLPAAAWQINLAAFFMRTEPHLVLLSRRAVPERLVDSGFTFLFPRWPDAAHDLVARWRRKYAA